jgi:hypothetical protein
MFFNNPKYCKQVSTGEYVGSSASSGEELNKECAANNKLSLRMRALQNQYSASQEKIDNVQLLYSRELIYTVNLTVGIGGLILYLYYNK